MILEERFKKNAKMEEEMIQNLKEERLSKAAEMTKLQEFHDKFDTILQYEKTTAQKEYIMLQEESDATEKRLKKELDTV